MSLTELQRRGRQREASREQPDPHSRFRRILKLPEVERLTGKSKTSIYEGVQAGTFPKPIPLGSRAIGFLEDELIAWQEKQIAARDAKSAA